MSKNEALTHRKVVSFVSSVDRVYALQDFQGVIVPSLRSKELGALVEEPQQAGGEGTGQSHDQGQETPGAVVDVEEADVV